MIGLKGYFQKLRIGSIAAVFTLLSFVNSSLLTLAPESLAGSDVHDMAADIHNIVSRSPPRRKLSLALHQANKGCRQTFKRYMLPKGLNCPTANKNPAMR